MYTFKTLTGTVMINHELCIKCKEKPCIVHCIPKILKEVEGKPVLAISEVDAAKGKCIECLACELECIRIGKNAIDVILPLPDVSEDGLKWQS